MHRFSFPLLFVLTLAFASFVVFDGAKHIGIFPNDRSDSRNSGDELSLERLVSEALAAVGGTVSMNNNRVVNIGYPSAASDAATKQYTNDRVALVVAPVHAPTFAQGGGRNGLCSFVCH